MAREGKARTAEWLGVGERTLRRTLESEHLSRRVTSALLREQNELRDEQRAAKEMQQLDELGDLVAAAGRHAQEAQVRVPRAPYPHPTALSASTPGLADAPTAAGVAKG